MRNSFLLVLKINLFGLSAKAKWGYATPEQAKAAGISDDKYKRSKRFVSQLEKLFVDKAGGSKASLKRNILTSKKARLNGVLGNPAAAAPIIAALPMITAVVKLLSENGLLSKKEAADINSKVKNKDLNISAEDASELESIAKEEEKQDNSAADDKDKSKDTDEKSFFTKAFETVKEHPFIAVCGLLVLSYFFVPPVKNFVNGLLHIGKKTTPRANNALSGNHVNTLEGIGKKSLPPAHKSPAKEKKVGFINLK